MRTQPDETSSNDGTSERKACSKRSVKSKARHCLATAGPNVLSSAKVQTGTFQESVRVLFMVSLLDGSKSKKLDKSGRFI